METQMNRTCYKWVSLKWTRTSAELDLQLHSVRLCYISHGGYHCHTQPCCSIRLVAVASRPARHGKVAVTDELHLLQWLELEFGLCSSALVTVPAGSASKCKVQLGRKFVFGKGTSALHVRRLQWIRNACVL